MNRSIIGLVVLAIAVTGAYLAARQCGQIVHGPLPRSFDVPPTDAKHDLARRGWWRRSVLTKQQRTAQQCNNERCPDVPLLCQHSMTFLWVMCMYWRTRGSQGRSPWAGVSHCRQRAAVW